MTESLSTWMAERSEPDWSAVIHHPFTDALFTGAMPPAVMRGYLVQDYQFVDDFVALLGAALARADGYSSRLVIARAIATVTSTENTYFERALDALDVPADDRSHPELDAATSAFRELMADTTERGGYSEALTVLTVAEWSYLEWARRAPERLPADSAFNEGAVSEWICREWIALHDNPDFRRWVEWLRAELDRVGTALDEREQAHCLRLFQRATRCERDFFDAHWG
ncbi:TenA family protein [Bounagaea algeriensis]